MLSWVSVRSEILAQSEFPLRPHEDAAAQMLSLVATTSLVAETSPVAAASLAAAASQVAASWS
jgi:hypothetical protein